jgi:hypothetical protein
MKSSSARDWLIDTVIVVVLGGIAVFIVPLVSACLGTLLLSLPKGRNLFWVCSILVLGDWLPHAAVGFLVGLAAGGLVRHRQLWLAVLPALLCASFYAIYGVFGP